MTLEPYGPLTSSTLRLVSWNVWGQFGPWRERQTAIGEALASVSPDIVTLQEAFTAPEYDQAGQIASTLGFPHHQFVGNRGTGGELSGTTVLSRWPIASTEQRPLGESLTKNGSVLRADISGPRGLVRVFSVIMDWPPWHSAVRQAQVRELTEYVSSVDGAAVTVVCGDFNAPPDSDEIRMLTGRAAGVFWYDAWEFAGEGLGCTWSNSNPWAAAMLFRDQRIDYVFTTRVGAGGVGHPVDARLVGTAPVASDHFGVAADLRY